GRREGAPHSWCSPAFGLEEYIPNPLEDVTQHRRNFYPQLGFGAPGTAHMSLSTQIMSLSNFLLLGESHSRKNSGSGDALDGPSDARVPPRAGTGENGGHDAAERRRHRPDDPAPAGLPRPRGCRRTARARG